MQVGDMVASGAIVGFCILGIAGPTFFVARAFHTSSTLDRVGFVAGALGVLLLALQLLEIAAHTVATTSALVGWMARTLATYAAATTPLYSSLVLGVWGGIALSLTLLGIATAANQKSHRVAR